MLKRSASLLCVTTLFSASTLSTPINTKKLSTKAVPIYPVAHHISSPSNGATLTTSGFIIKGGSNTVTEETFYLRINGNPVEQVTSQYGSWQFTVHPWMAKGATISVRICNTPQECNYRNPTRTYRLDTGWSRALLHRATYGPNKWVRDRMAVLGPTGFLNEQLKPSQLNDDDFLSRYPFNDEEPAIDEVTGKYLRSAWYPSSMALLQDEFFYRGIFTQKQLNEVMTFFWENHFHTQSQLSSLKDNPSAPLNYPPSALMQAEYEEHKLFRKYALGNFLRLLRTSMNSPAMALYLDNFVNNANNQAPNENYARELMELHTLGIHDSKAVYDQEAIEAVAKVLSGWTLKHHPANGELPARLEPHFEAAMHVNGGAGPVSLYPYSYISQGQGNKTHYNYFTNTNNNTHITQLIHLLGTHPSTANYICKKLIKFFIARSDTDAIAATGSDLVNQCAAEFITNKYHEDQIANVVRIILQSNAFKTAGTTKIRSALEHMLATTRLANVTHGPCYAENCEGDDHAEYQLGINNSYLIKAGMNPFQYPAPDGHSDMNAEVLSASSLLWRNNFANAVANNWFTTYHQVFNASQNGRFNFDWKPYFESVNKKDNEALLFHAFNNLASINYSLAEWDRGLEMLDDVDAAPDYSDDKKLSELLRYVVGVPSFQRQ